MALVTTCATTPLTTLLYPEWYQKKLELWKKGKIDWDGNPITPDIASDEHKQEEAVQGDAVRRILVYLRLDALPGLFTFISLMGDRDAQAEVGHLGDDIPPEKGDDYSSALARRRNALEVHGLRLVELTERTSSSMQVAEIQEYASYDPVVKAFRTFCQFHDVAVAGSLAVVPERSYADTLLGRAFDVPADLLLIPWSETGSMSEQNPIPLLQDDPKGIKSLTGTYAAFVSSLFPAPASSQSSITTSAPYSSTNIGIFVDRGFSLPSSTPATMSRGSANAESKRPNHTLQRTDTGLTIHTNNDSEKPTLPHRLGQTYHILVPFFGGEDDEFGLRFALQLAKKENVNCSVIYFVGSSTVTGDQAFQAESPSDLISAARDGLPGPLRSRVTFSTREISTTNSTSSSVSAVLAALLSTTMGRNSGPSAAGDLLIIGRRSGGAIGAFDTSDRPSNEESVMNKSFGRLATAVLSSESYCGSVLVVQAAGRSGQDPSRRKKGQEGVLATTKGDDLDDSD